jgi:hypothetical protein
MATSAQVSPRQPQRIGVTLFLERPAEIDYRRLIERIGEPLGIAPNAADHAKPGGALVLPVSGDVVMGLRIDMPYPERLDGPAMHAYWWPNATTDIARSTSHLMVFCAWSGFSRLEAHQRHLILVRGLAEQLPVIGLLWGSVLSQSEVIEAWCDVMLKGTPPFPLWVLIQGSRQPNGNVLLSTLGMRDFEQMEIETESSLSPEESQKIVREFGAHILTEGPVVKDGDTIGFNPEQRITVRHRRSFRPDVNDNVYWLELTEKPTVPRPTGFFSRLFGSSRKQ